MTVPVAAAERTISKPSHKESRTSSVDTLWPGTSGFPKAVARVQLVSDGSVLLMKEMSAGPRLTKRCESDFCHSASCSCAPSTSGTAAVMVQAQQSRRRSLCKRASRTAAAAALAART